MTIGNIREVPQPIRDAAMSVEGLEDRVAWGELIGLHLTGKSKQADMGPAFADDIAKLSVDELLELRYQLRDHFLDAYRGGPTNSEDDSAIDSVVRCLVEILEAEIGGRWVNS